MRVRAFQRWLHEHKVALALFLVEEQPEPNVVYFAQLPDVTHAALAIPARGKQKVFVSALDYEGVKRQGVVLARGALLGAVKKQAAKQRVGVDFSRLPLQLAHRLQEWGCELVDVRAAVEKLRAVKTRREAALLRKAARIASEAFLSLMRDFHFTTEAEVRAALEHAMAVRGAAAAFPTIVASGKNAAVPHHRTSNEGLGRGFCVIDFGAVHQGYRSDCTRTVFIGKPTPQEKRLYQRVLQAQERGLHALRAGARCGDVDRAARKALGVYQRYFVHSLGHGIGVEVHEAPHLGAKSTETLQEGMVVTVEPGIYLPDRLGIRIEDMVLVGRRPEALTSPPTELMVVPLRR